MLSHVSLFENPWTVAHQAPLSLGILQARILESVALPFSRGSSLTQGSNLGLLHYRQILYYLSHQRNPRYSLRTGNSYFFISSRVASLYSLKSDIAVFENSQMLLRTQIGDYRKPSAVMLLCVPAHL